MADQELHLESFMFRGQKRYRCPSCGFDHYEIKEVVKHWAQLHRVKTPAAVGPTLFDSYGSPIEKEEEKENIHVYTELPDFGSGPARREDDTEELFPAPDWQD